MSILRRMKYDHADDSFVVASYEDSSPYLKENRRLYALNDGYTPSREMRRVASIPPLLVERWMREEGISVFKDEDWPKIAAKLDDPEYQFLRTAPGKVSRRPVREYPTTIKAHRVDPRRPSVVKSDGRGWLECSDPTES